MNLARPRRAGLQLALDTGVLLLLAVLLGAAFNAWRAPATRLPWSADWDRHIETLAYRAGIPVTFLIGVRNRMSDPETVFFDARSIAEYAAGRLPSAKPMPVAEAAERIGDHILDLTTETPIVVYCGGLDCPDALELALRLREFGFSDVTLYPGGFEEWVAYGGAVEKDPGP